MIDPEGGYLGGKKEHPKNIQVMVKPGRYYNGPEGEHNGPLSTLWMAECQLEPNAAIVWRVDGDEHKKYLKTRKANRASAGTQTRA